MAKRERLWQPKPHRAVDWNERAVQRALDRGPVLACYKVDGIRCLVRLFNGVPTITTREGIEIEALRPYAATVFEETLELWDYISAERYVLDCEVFIKDVDFDTGSGVLRRRSPLPQTYKPVFVVFDFCTVRQMLGEPEPCDTYDLRYRHRLLCTHLSPFEAHRRLSEPATVVHEMSFWAHTSGDIDDIYGYARRDGYEGLVVKDPSLLYRNSKVTGWWKRKPEISEDGIVTDYVWGEEGKANEGKAVGYVVELESGETVRATGLTREQIEEATWCATVAPPERSHVGRYVEVTAMERTASGKLRHPAFKCFRDMPGAEGVKS